VLGVAGGGVGVADGGFAAGGVAGVVAGGLGVLGVVAAGVLATGAGVGAAPVLATAGLSPPPPPQPANFTSAVPRTNALAPCLSARRRFAPEKSAEGKVLQVFMPNAQFRKL
jgi:hypothetical protein